MTHAVPIWTRMPHFSAAAAALATFAALLGLAFGPLHLERRLAHLTAPEILDVKDQGLALQDEAFRDKDLLPAYGSSEFRNASPFSGRLFFSSYPTGFGLFVVGKAGSKTLITAERIGALGNDVRGKKVVIILSPTWFLSRAEPVASYRGNFSALQASKLVFDSPLSPSLKSDLAREMLKYPKSLSGEPLLRRELQRLASRRHETVEDRLVDDLGRTEDFFRSLLDRVETTFALSGDIAEHPMQLSDTSRHAKTTPNWDALVGDAAVTGLPQLWENQEDTAAPKLARKLRGKDDSTFTAMLSRTDEWNHLSLLLRTLRELGAKPLFISIPINADAFEMAGVKPAQLDFYYARLRDAVGDYHYPLVTFEKEQSDPYFFADSVGHPSSKGWMVFNHVINQFYHGKLPPSQD